MLFYHVHQPDCRQLELLHFFCNQVTGTQGSRFILVVEL